MSFNIENAWSPYAPLMPLVDVATLIETPLAWMGEPLDGLVPSILMVADGPKVDGVVLSTAPFIAYVDFLQQGTERFTFIHRHRISRLTWTLANAEMPSSAGADVMEKYETAILEVQVAGSHAFPVHYAGRDRAAWIARASAVFSVGRTLRGG